MTLTPTEIHRLADEFEGKPPRDILQWVADRFAPRAAISTAFGPEGLVILDIALRKVTPRLPVFTIDTGYLFKEPGTDPEGGTGVRDHRGAVASRVDAGAAS